MSIRARFPLSTTHAPPWYLAINPSWYSEGPFSPPPPLSRSLALSFGIDWRLTLRSQVTTRRTGLFEGFCTIGGMLITKLTGNNTYMREPAVLMRLSRYKRLCRYEEKCVIDSANEPSRCIELVSAHFRAS